MRRSLSFLAVWACTPTPHAGNDVPKEISAPANENAFTVEHRTLALRDSTVLRYTLDRPRNAAGGSARIPLVLVLHYSAPKDSIPPYYGEELLDRLVRPALGKLGAILVAPDAPGRGWADARSEQAVVELLDHLRATLPVDDRRTLVTGMSLGGMGTWYLVTRHPQRFRAAIPIASFPMLRTGRTLADRESQLRAIAADTLDTWTVPFRHVPIYIIHSRADAVLPLASVELAVAVLRRSGADVQLMQLDSPTHFQTRAYVESLRDAIPWIERQWSRPE